MARVALEPAPVRVELRTGLSILAVTLMGATLAFVATHGNLGLLGTRAASAVVAWRNLFFGRLRGARRRLEHRRPAAGGRHGRPGRRLHAGRPSSRCAPGRGGPGPSVTRAVALVAALLPLLAVSGSARAEPTREPAPRITLKTHGSLREVAERIASEGKLSVVVRGDLDEDAEVFFQNVPADEALETLARAYGLSLEKRGNIYSLRPHAEGSPPPKLVGPMPPMPPVPPVAPVPPVPPVPPDAAHAEMGHPGHHPRATTRTPTDEPDPDEDERRDADPAPGPRGASSARLD